MRNRVAANLIFFGVCLAGYIALGGVPHELLPETSSPAVVVRVVLPGAEAEVVESRVLLPLEDALRGIEGVRETTGLAVEEAAALTLVLEAGADIRRIGDRVRERVGSLTTLPAEAEDPVVSEIAENREIFRIAVHGVAGERDLHEAARRVQDAVAAVRGVSGVERLTGVGAGTDDRDPQGEPDALRADFRSGGGCRAVGFRGDSCRNGAQRHARAQPENRRGRDHR